MKLNNVNALGYSKRTTRYELLNFIDGIMLPMVVNARAWFKPHWYILGQNFLFGLNFYSLRKCRWHRNFPCSVCPLSHNTISLQWRGISMSLQWRHNRRDCVSNHQPHDCFLNRLFRHRSKKTSKLRVTGLCAGNSPEAGEFPAQMASNAENVSIWWRRHVESCELMTTRLSNWKFLHC